LNRWRAAPWAGARRRCFQRGIADRRGLPSRRWRHGGWLPRRRHGVVGVASRLPQRSRLVSRLNRGGLGPSERTPRHRRGYLHAAPRAESQARYEIDQGKQSQQAKDRGAEFGPQQKLGRRGAEYDQRQEMIGEILRAWPRTLDDLEHQQDD